MSDLLKLRLAIFGLIVLAAVISASMMAFLQSRAGTPGYISVRDVDTGCVFRLHHDGRRYVQLVDEYRSLSGAQVCGALPE